MTRIFICALFIFSAVPAFAQEQSSGESILALKNLSSFGIANSATQFAPGSTVIGTPYLQEDWVSSDIVLTTGEKLKSYSVRFNILSNILEVKVLNEVKGIEAARLAILTTVAGTTTRYYITGTAFGEDGLYEVLDTGNLTLLRKTELTVKPPDYSPQFNVGSRDTRILKKDTYWVKADTTINALSLQPRRFFKTFGEAEDTVRSFATRNNLELGTDADLVRIFRYYNTQYAANGKP